MKTKSSIALSLCVVVPGEGTSDEEAWLRATWGVDLEDCPQQGQEGMWVLPETQAPLARG